MTKRRFWETAAAFARRQDLEAARKAITGKKLWRITAIEMIKQSNGGWQMGRQDHFTVEACSEEMAIGVFKFRTAGMMHWFVTSVVEESVSR